MKELIITCSCNFINRFDLEKMRTTKPFFLEFICTNCAKGYKMELMLPITKNGKP